VQAKDRHDCCDTHFKCKLAFDDKTIGRGQSPALHTLIPHGLFYRSTAQESGCSINTWNHAVMLLGLNARKVIWQEIHKKKWV
jgi:hypothetical protein